MIIYTYIIIYEYDNIIWSYVNVKNKNSSEKPIDWRKTHESTYYYTFKIYKSLKIKTR